MENSLIKLLQYDALEAKKDKWVQEEKLLVYDNWLPFHFAYHDLFIGLTFVPIDLGWRKLDTVQDLFELCFQLSLILWLNINEQVEDPRKSALKLFAIPIDFHTADLPLRYSYRCSSKIGRVVSFLPRQLPLLLYSEEDYKLLIDWYNVDPPNDQVINMFQGIKPFFSTSSHNKLIDRFQRKHNFTPINYKGEAPPDNVVYRILLEYILRITNEPSEKYNYPDETQLLTASTYDQWELHWEEWIFRQFEWIILYKDSISDYQCGDYARINNSCRKVGEHDLEPHTTKLLQLCSLTPPLPTSVIVSRALNGRQFNDLPLNQELIEHGFMSTSLGEYTSFHAYSNTFLRLKAPTGMSVIAVLAVGSNSEKELLFPPGTRYILHRKEEKYLELSKRALTIFYGEILL